MTADDAKRKVRFPILRQMHREAMNGKVSSKKVWGSIILTCAMASYLADGTEWYTVNTALFETCMYVGASLIGLLAIKEIASVIATRGNTPKSGTTKEEDLPIN